MVLGILYTEPESSQLSILLRSEQELGALRQGIPLQGHLSAWPSGFWKLSVGVITHSILSTGGPHDWTTFSLLWEKMWGSTASPLTVGIPGAAGKVSGEGQEWEERKKRRDGGSFSFRMWAALGPINSSALYISLSCLNEVCSSSHHCAKSIMSSAQNVNWASQKEKKNWSMPQRSPNSNQFWGAIYNIFFNCQVKSIVTTTGGIQCLFKGMGEKYTETVPHFHQSQLLSSWIKKPKPSQKPGFPANSTQTACQGSAHLRGRQTTNTAQLFCPAPYTQRQGPGDH